MLLLQGKSGSGSNDQGCPSDVLRNISGAFQIFQDVTKYVKQVCVSVKSKLLHSHEDKHRQERVRSWTAIIQHQRLALATFCQLSGLGQWLCGDSKGKPAELAYLILAERVSTSKNTDQTASQCAQYLQDHPNEVIAEKRARLQFQKKGQGGKNMATTFISQTP